MSNDTKFIDGLIFKAPNDNAPEYVIAKISIKRADLIAWLQAQPGDWINADLKESQQGKLYAAVDTWRPNQGGAQNQQRREPARNSSADIANDETIPF
jgi:hypothetical protein